MDNHNHNKITTTQHPQQQQPSLLPPPRPSPHKARSIERWRTNSHHGDDDDDDDDNHENDNNDTTTTTTTRRQIFLPSSSHNIFSSPPASAPTTSSLLQDNNNLNAIMGVNNQNCSPHRAKRRRGTPPNHHHQKHSPYFYSNTGKENPNHPPNNNNNGSSVMSTTTTTAKTLFGAPRQLAGRNNHPNVALFASAAAPQEDPWETVRSLSPQQQRSRYWNLCYGSHPPPPQGQWSASRAKPRKGCLSILGHRSLDGSNKTLFVSPSMEDLQKADSNATTATASSSCATPRSSSEARTTRGVQFGPTKAAEYNTLESSVHLTPLPDREAAQLYPTDLQKPTQAELSLLQETKDNTALLEEWEEDEGSSELSATFTLGGGDSSEDDTPLPQQRGRHRSQRRSSTLFRPGRLLEDNDDDKDEEKKDDVAMETTPDKNDTTTTLLNQWPGLSLSSPPLAAEAASSSGDMDTTQTRGNEKEGEDADVSSVDEDDDNEDSLDSRRLSNASSVDTASTASTVETVRSVAQPPPNDDNQEMDNDSMTVDSDDGDENPFGGRGVSTTEEERHATRPTQQQAQNDNTTAQQPSLWAALAQGETLLRSLENNANDHVNDNTPPSWVRHFAEHDSLRPLLEAALTRMEQHYTPTREMAQMVRLTRQLNERTTELKAEQEYVYRALVEPMPRALVGRRLEQRLHDEIVQLEDQVDQARTRIAALRQERDRHLEPRLRIQQQRRVLEALGQLAPMDAVLRSEQGLIEMTFDPTHSGLVHYAPGQTVRLEGDLSTGLVMSVSLVSVGDDNDTTAAPQTQRQKKCKTLLDQVLDRAQDKLVAETMDCSQAVMQWMITLSQLERHYHSLATCV